jgi:hypothetical protein
MNLQETSTSELLTLAKCPKKFEYRYRRGLIPQDGPAAMNMGTLYHAGAAAGYQAMKTMGVATGWPGLWITSAINEVTKKNPVDRDGVLLGLSDENVQVVCDMLNYYEENMRINDNFLEIVAVEEPCTFSLNGYTIRTTMDLLTLNQQRQYEVFDHKTSGDIAADQSHLPLDLQLRIYYYSVWKRLGFVPSRFVHNYSRRFDFSGAQRVGPPGWSRPDGTYPYRLTAGGKVATRSDDPNDYVRRISTPLTLNQLQAFERELTGKLGMLAYHDMTKNYPRHDEKGPMGCGGCSYYSLCTTEADGHIPNPSLLGVLFKTLQDAPTSIVGKRFG